MALSRKRNETSCMSYEQFPDLTAGLIVHYQNDGPHRPALVTEVHSYESGEVGLAVFSSTSLQFMVYVPYVGREELSTRHHTWHRLGECGSQRISGGA